MIQFITEEVKMPAIDKSKVKSWIKAVAESYGRKTGDVSYVFCNDERILQVNNQYLQHDYYTDIITFDYSTITTISGDIFISLDTVKSNSEAFKTDYSTELHRIIIHGILHLCGNDDKTPELRALMTEKENVALRLGEFEDLSVC
jgi:rRNA maturation RNase YbeY